MTSARALIAIVLVVTMAYFAGRYWSRWKLLRGRRGIAISEILQELPEGVDRHQAEEVLCAIGLSYGLKPEDLRLDDSLSKLAAIDSWMLGKGQEALEKWLRSNGVDSFQNSPETIHDLIISVLPSFEKARRG